MADLNVSGVDTINTIDELARIVRTTEKVVAECRNHGDLYIAVSFASALLDDIDDWESIENSRPFMTQACRDVISIVNAKRKLLE